MVGGSFAKVHQHGTGARRNGETPPDSAMKQAIGRSRGGLTSKIMALTDVNGRICRFSVVPGNAAKGRALPDLMAGVQTREVIGDKAYDSGAIRQMLADRNIVSTIPSLSNRKTIVWYDPDHYATRHMVGKLVCRCQAVAGHRNPVLQTAGQLHRAFLNLKAWHLSTKAGGRATKKPVYKRNYSLAPVGQIAVGASVPSLNAKCF